jgi:hypothetical protein
MVQCFNQTADSQLLPYFATMSNLLNELGARQQRLLEQQDALLVTPIKHFIDVNIGSAQVVHFHSRLFSVSHSHVYVPLSHIFFHCLKNMQHKVTEARKTYEASTERLHSLKKKSTDSSKIAKVCTHI